MRVILRICDHLFVLRPVILLPAWSFYLIGASSVAGGPPRQGAIPSPGTALCLTATLVTAYLLNQIFDRESDEQNNKCLFLSRQIFAVRTLVLMAVVSFFVASFLYHRVDSVQKAPLVAALALSFAYSLPPVRLCARPFLDLAANAIGYGGIAVVLGFGVFEPSRAAALRVAAPYVLLVASTFLHTTILDFAGDSATGKKSTSVLIGLRPSVVLAAVLHGFAFTLALVTRNAAAALVTGASLPVTLYALAKQPGAVSSLVIQANTLIVTLAAAFFWPVYLAVVVPLVVLSRFYHRRRFGITYPGPAKIV